MGPDPDTHRREEADCEHVQDGEANRYDLEGEPRGCEEYRGVATDIWHDPRVREDGDTALVSHA